MLIVFTRCSQLSSASTQPDAAGSLVDGAVLYRESARSLWSSSLLESTSSMLELKLLDDQGCALSFGGLSRDFVIRRTRYTYGRLMHTGAVLRPAWNKCQCR